MSATPLSDREWALWRALTLMSRQLNGIVEHRLNADAQISRPDFEILNALAEQEDKRARSRDLAEMLAWEKSRISHQVKRMVQRGLVERSECEADLRGTWISITQEGEAALALALPGYADEVRARFTDMLDGTSGVVFAESALKVIEATDPETCMAEIDRIQQVVRGSHEPQSASLRAQ
jgi:DNA-binding MarR family transcriptional regulator